MNTPAPSRPAPRTATLTRACPALGLAKGDTVTIRRDDDLAPPGKVPAPRYTVRVVGGTGHRSAYWFTGEGAAPKTLRATFDDIAITVKYTDAGAK